jgi:transcriptional regulator with GAF, ATPase, and Fis domain
VNVNSLQQIMLSIAEARDLESILHQIVSGVAHSFDLVLARLWLVQPDKECPICASEQNNGAETRTLHLRASAGKSRETGVEYSRITGSFHRIPWGARKVGHIASSGQPMLIAEVRGDESWVADPGWIKREGIKSFAGHPLVFKGETLGVLAVFGRAAFVPEAFQWLRTFADHAAVAIANAKAFEELERLKRRLEAENEYLQQEIGQTLKMDEIVGQAPSLKKVLQQVALVADTTATVLIHGESGTGKELIARAIHQESARRARSFVKVNCGAIPEELFESEFFGHVKGAFTGAIKDRIGRFELANTGTLFLDEVAEIPLALQAKLLRVLQEQQFERVGESRTRTVDVRVIAATNRDLRREVEEGQFREDLFYRLTVFPIELPPLRQRKEDIATLAAHFVKRSAARLRIKPPPLTRENVCQLQDYDWPGNIRELENVIERAMILSKSSRGLSFDLKYRVRARPAPRNPPPPPPSEIVPGSNQILTRSQLREHETANILAALKQANGKIFGRGGAAEILGMRPTTLASRVKALGLRKAYFAVLGEE